MLQDHSQPSKLLYEPSNRSLLGITTLIYRQIIKHSASADTSADMPEGRFIKLKILLKHSRML